MNYMKIDTCDIANGKYLGVVLWVSGCDLRCKECHNSIAWDFNAGTPFTFDTLETLCSLLNKPYIKRLTISGGHPFAEQNVAVVGLIIDHIKYVMPDKEIWIYTGYNLKEQDIFEKYGYLLSKCDYVVDGEYIEGLRDVTLPFRGSSNQRIIDLKKTIETKKLQTMKEV